ncbi:MAG: winged helix DNA-binding protein [Nitrosopumilaceae archaeon]|nr:helix-turn-helix transcriptional regulator [Nitrosopumilaceae archaeon]NIU00885.1 helix-turn-helix transcriptional regulator [Nitrosopumilaceae archaeon]NIU87338.1 winged helix DNA-binding protein [Nitrosopumilaceae archaeon]NIV65866.1 winged helix DNA-binding protein [Nitrosopumilaceae archaeon]NIX61487.1 winged helix DNA-binding protein [Nitrosopumilaceae archaeon]
MPLEISDFQLVIGVIIAFVGGILVFYLVNRLAPVIKTKTDSLDRAHLERLEYYERQLIDMKIRLDAMEMVGQDNTKSSQVNEELRNILEKITKNEEKSVKKSKGEKPYVSEVNEVKTLENEPDNITEHILRLITKNPMTSRDIQITLKRSREHTSRLLKKLHDEGLVTRNTESKPYTYIISEKGKERLGLLNSAA